jgi:hypothetical protein
MSSVVTIGGELLELFIRELSLDCTAISKPFKALRASPSHRFARSWSEALSTITFASLLGKNVNKNWE